MKNTLLPLLTIAALLQANLLIAQSDPAPSGIGSSTSSSKSRGSRKANATPPTTEPWIDSEAEGKGIGAPPSAGNGNFSFSLSRAADTISPVIVDFTALDDKTVRGLHEDLSIMTHLIKQNLEQGPADEVDIKMGIPLLLTSGARSVRALYLGDLGACFMIKVSFPVFGQTAVPETKPAEQPTANDEWLKAKNEILGELDQQPSSSRSSAYKPEVVAALQKQLIGALKNATNIRHLKPNESVVISVFGASQSSSDRGSRSVSGSSGIMELASFGSRGTVMNLRVSKADIDAFAQGKLSEDDFRKKVQIAAYNGSGNDMISINSWIKSGSSSLSIR